MQTSIFTRGNHRAIQEVFCGTFQDIIKADIGIAPRMTDNPYDKAHSFFKIGVFLAQGVPVIASPVPSYKQFLSDGTAGSICDTLDSWAKTLELVDKDRNLLPKWADSGRKLIKPFSTDAISKEYVCLFNEILSR